MPRVESETSKDPPLLQKEVPFRPLSSVEVSDRVGRRGRGSSVVVAIFRRAFRRECVSRASRAVVVVVVAVVG